MKWQKYVKCKNKTSKPLTIDCLKQIALNYAKYMQDDKP